MRERDREREREREGNKKLIFSFLGPLVLISNCRLTKPVSAVETAASRLFSLPKTLRNISTNLMFMNPCIVIQLWKNQQDSLYRLIYYSMSALHVSGDVFAHHQEHLTVFTVSGSVHPSCCRLVSRHQPEATWVNTTRYYKCSRVLLMTGESIARNM